MKHTFLIWLGGLAAMVSGSLLVAVGVLTLSSGFSSGSSSLYRTMEALFAVSLILVPVGFVGFHTLQRQNYGRIGHAGFWVVITASAWLAAALGSYFWGGSDALWVPAWAVPFALVLVWVGFVLYGIATLQAGMLPRWCGVAFIVALPVVVIFDLLVGVLLVGLIWLALGYALWKRRGVATEQPSRVR